MISYRSMVLTDFKAVHGNVELLPLNDICQQHVLSNLYVYILHSFIKFGISISVLNYIPSPQLLS